MEVEHQQGAGLQVLGLGNLPSRNQALFSQHGTQQARHHGEGDDERKVCE